MREANWDQMFQRREGAHATVDERVSALVPWEDWLTLLITAVVFMSVVYSVDSAHWVNGMPTLYPVAFAGLLTGYFLSRIRRHALLVEPLGLLFGAALVYLQLLAILPGGSPAARTDNMLDRMYVWWYAVTNNGISSDPLPLIVLTLVLLWLGTYFSSRAIFHWRNPWLGLVPGGVALMWNISFLPGQFSYAFVVFVFAAVLLLMRMHLSHKEVEWERNGVRYPEFISLSVLNATFWVTLALLVAVWLVPLANRSDTASQRWQDFTSPYTARLAPFARLFVSLNAKKPIEIHNLKDALALQGNIQLSGKQAVQLNVKLTPQMAAFLRAQSFDQYTSNGWKVNVTSNVPLPPVAPADVAPSPPGGTRQQVTVRVTVEGGNNSTLFSLGQPQQATTPSEARTGSNRSDISSLKPAARLNNGDSYAVTGSVSVASVDQLRATGTDYPAWVTKSYLGTGQVPERVAEKAREVTSSATTAYDKAAAIEAYLRTFPVDYSVPPPPPGRDAVDYFLFDAQRGYFDYHASAMAIMLRTLGIPARVATGYVIDPAQRQAGTDTYNLTERNAFTWPEVYFPGAGWVEFSPTPDQPPINRPGTAATGIGQGGGHGTKNDPINLGALAGEPTLTSQPAVAPRLKATRPSGGSDGLPIWLPLAVVGSLAVVVVAGGRFAWEYGMADLPRPARVWKKTQRLARWSRSGTQPSDTPREFARRLGHDVGAAAPVAYLADVYERTTFGRKELSDDEQARVDAAWQLVRRRLLARILRRQ
ncbi:MAG: transglutaminase domain-containing protein [Dehalococcoidia bacterium]|nr:transglutaminase domain-containing protein [Dehalococcoidia bacterium]